MTTKTDHVQFGLSVDATDNFTLTTDGAGGARLARGNAGATIQDILTVDADGRIVQGLLPACIRLNTANGYGSTNTKIRRFTNIVLNQGNDITYTDSATLGASFTINKDGVYSINYSDQFSSAGFFAISVNTTQPTVAASTINISHVLSATTTAQSAYASCVNWCGYLVAGSVIRAHSDGAATGVAVNGNQFTITRVA